MQQATEPESVEPGRKDDVREEKDVYNNRVFLNFPYDAEYKPLIDAIVFTIHACGFTSTAAVDNVGSGDARLDKIRGLIAESRYSIHDLSRIEQPRLNMAFEAGLCYGAKFFGGEKHATKDLLILDAADHRYKLTLSDISGVDAMSHNGDPKAAISCVRKFLARKTGIKPFVGASHIVKLYEQFKADLPAFAENVHDITLEELNELDYLPDLAEIMAIWLSVHEGHHRRSGKRSSAPSA